MRCMLPWQLTGLHVSGFNTHSVLEGKEQTHMLRALTETLLVMG